MFPPDKQGRQGTLYLWGHLLELARNRGGVLWVSSLDSKTNSEAGSEGS